MLNFIYQLKSYKIMKKNVCFIAILFFMAISVKIFAGPPTTWTASGLNTNWNDASNWDRGVPTSALIATIPTNPTGGNFFPVIEVANADCYHLLINAGASVSVPSNKILNIYGDLTNSGNANLGQGNVVFSGTAQQTVNGTNIFNNLTINNINGVILSGTSTISGILKLTSGTLTTNNYLTLLSIASKTAIISGTGTGSISGNVKVQRYFGSVLGYYYLSSPVEGTFQQVANNMAVIGWGTDFKSGGWSNLWKYDETDISQVTHPDGVRMNGWKTPANPSVEFNTMEGFTVYADANKTFTFNGIVNNGSKNIPLTNTSSVSSGGSSFDDGWNLVGNPYPCPIDWDAASGWTKTNVANALYFYSASGQYKSYINGIGAPSGVTGVIAPGQGFFVKAINNGTLGVTNTVRIDNTNSTFYKKDNSKQMLRLNVYNASSPELSDETVVYFDANAQNVYDPSLDAFKLMNSSELLPSLYTIKANMDKLSINSQSVIGDEEITVPLGINVKKTGDFVINATEITNLSPNTQITLVDNALNIIQNLNESPKYRFNIKTNVTEGRFFLKINPKNSKTGIDTKSDNTLFYTYTSNKVLNVSYNNSLNKNATLDIYNLLGQNVINTQVITAGNHKYNLNKGCYIVRLVANNKVNTKKITIE